MSSIVDPHPELPASEELVAYLDGELPPDDCRRVEERLAADDDYRQQLRDLDQAWEALDALPHAKPTTISPARRWSWSTVAAEGDAVGSHGERGARQAPSRVAAGRGGRCWPACLLGFVAAWLLLPNPNGRCCDDLPVIRQVDVLRRSRTSISCGGWPTKCRPSD